MTSLTLRTMLYCVVALNSSLVFSHDWTDVWSGVGANAPDTLKRVSSVRMDEEMMKVLAEKGETTHLRLVNADTMDNAAWNYIFKLKKLKHLEIGTNIHEPGNFNGPGIGFDGTNSLGAFANIKQLEAFVVYGLEQKNDNDTFSWLEKFTNLKELRLIDVDVYREGAYHGLGKEVIETICKLTTLERLEFGSVALDDALVDKLLALTNLKELRIHNCELSDEGVAKLAGLKQLETFEISAPGAKTGSFIAKFPNLKSFGCNLQSHWPLEAISVIKEWKNLRDLSFYRGIRLGVMPLVCSLTQLESLSFVTKRDGRPGEDEEWSVAKLTSLKKLRIRGMVVNDKQLNDIFGLKALKSLTLQFPMMVTAKAMTGISKLVNLKELYLERKLGYNRGQSGTDIWVNKDVIKAIAKLSKLERLELAGFAPIKFENGIKKLVEEDKAVGPSTIEPLSKIESLRYLSIRGSALTLESLEGFKQLRHLNADLDVLTDTEMHELSRKRPELRVSAWRPWGR